MASTCLTALAKVTGQGTQGYGLCFFSETRIGFKVVEDDAGNATGLFFAQPDRLGEEFRAEGGKRAIVLAGVLLESE